MAIIRENFVMMNQKLQISCSQTCLFVFFGFLGFFIAQGCSSELENIKSTRPPIRYMIAIKMYSVYHSSCFFCTPKSNITFYSEIIKILSHCLYKLLCEASKYINNLEYVVLLQITKICHFLLIQSFTQTLNLNMNR